MIFLPEKKKIISPFGKVISPFSDLQIPKARHFMAQRGMMAASGTVIPGDETSYKFDGTGDYLTIPDHADWEFGTGDFTIDFRIRLNSTTFAQTIVHQETGGIWSVILHNTPNGIKFQTGGFDFDQTSGQTWSIDTWYHLEVSREGNNWYMFKDGTQVGNVTNATTVDNPTGLLHIGRQITTRYVNGYIDEFRISDIARHTSNFTPETKQYVSDANTKLLIHCGEEKSGTTGSGATFTDSGNTGHTVTENGDAIEETTIFKF